MSNQIKISFDLHGRLDSPMTEVTDVWRWMTTSFRIHDVLDVGRLHVRLLPADGKIIPLNSTDNKEPGLRGKRC